VVDTQFDRRRELRARGVGLREIPSQCKDEIVLNDVGNGSFEMGEWYTLSDRDEVMDQSMIPFFADKMVNLPDLLPKEMRGRSQCVLFLAFLCRADKGIIIILDGIQQCR
jgi:hypothetical protein